MSDDKRTTAQPNNVSIQPIHARDTDGFVRELNEVFARDLDRSFRNSILGQIVPWDPEPRYDKYPYIGDIRYPDRPDRAYLRGRRSLVPEYSDEHMRHLFWRAVFGVAAGDIRPVSWMHSDRGADCGVILRRVETNPQANHDPTTMPVSLIDEMIANMPADRQLEVAERLMLHFGELAQRLSRG